MTDDPHSNFQSAGYENGLSFPLAGTTSQLINYFLKDFLKTLVSMLFVFLSCELTLLLKLINNS